MQHVWESSLAVFGTEKDLWEGHLQMCCGDYDQEPDEWLKTCTVSNTVTIKHCLQR